jgi:hypothetical protein
MANKFLRWASPLMVSAYLTGCATSNLSRDYSSRQKVPFSSAEEQASKEVYNSGIEEQVPKENRGKSGSRGIKDEILSGAIEILLGGIF